MRCHQKEIFYTQSLFSKMRILWFHLSHLDVLTVEGWEKSTDDQLKLLPAAGIMPTHHHPPFTW